jgi:F-type H+-transporting ATPase subunit delta
VLVNPRLDLATRRSAIDVLVRGTHELTQNFVGLAFARGRVEVLVGLAAAFHRRILDDAGQVEGVVETARPMQPAEMDRVAADVGRVLGKKLILSNRVVPEVVGGARVIAGNRMLDGSVSGRLDALRRRLQDVPLPS